MTVWVIADLLNHPPDSPQRTGSTVRIPLRVRDTVALETFARVAICCTVISRTLSATVQLTLQETILHHASFCSVTRKMKKSCLLTTSNRQRMPIGLTVEDVSSATRAAAALFRITLKGKANRISILRGALSG